MLLCNMGRAKMELTNKDMFKLLSSIETTGQPPDPDVYLYPGMHDALNKRWVQPKRERGFPNLNGFPERSAHVAQYFDTAAGEMWSILYWELELTFWGLMELERLKKL